MQYFWAYFGYITQYTENLEYSLDILHDCIDITVVFTKLRNVLSFSLL